MKFETHWVITQDNQELCAKTWGDSSKPALVLVHGYPDNQKVWEPILASLVSDYYVVTYDVRGAGESSLPKRIKAYGLQQLSSDLETVVDWLLLDRPFHLAGHDWGSIQSWESVTDPRFKGRILSYTSISGPCLDHAAFWMRDQFKHRKAKFFKQLLKSWYIMSFHLPFIAPLFWRCYSPKLWGKTVGFMEKSRDLPLNQNVCRDGRYGIGLYRANFLPRLTRPRQLYAVCPVQAIVLKRDYFVSPELIDEVAKWASNFERVDLDANHWAVLSRPGEIASYIAKFALKYN